jgi:hypothetical protein
VEIGKVWTDFHFAYDWGKYRERKTLNYQTKSSIKPC